CIAAATYLMQVIGAPQRQCKASVTTAVHVHDFVIVATIRPAYSRVPKVSPVLARRSEYPAAKDRPMTSKSAQL
ncbi:hypothetical protein, partial [Stenotrophomonas maltophilia]|uniref:hypothetical protein n=1 Tax=Stenotrophomonas maltophilia TaxID=40324 RepID=UPI0019540B26